MELQPLFVYLLQNGGPKGVPETWAELADRFGIAQTNPNSKKRGNAARERWIRFLGSERGIELHSATIGPNGVTTKVTRQNQPEKEVSTEGLELEFVTTNPQGGAWVKYRNSKGYGLSEGQAKEAAEQLQGIKFDTKRAEGTGVGIVDLSDLHTGAVVKYAVETVKTLPFDFEILTRYIDECIEITNAYNFKELHVFLPGDLVESFTAFNHRDTWRHIQANQTGVVIFAYEILKRLFANLKNVKKIYMVEGNHDRMTAAKEGNTRKGIAEMLSYFLSENSDLNINYHPWIIGYEIDGAFHLCTHGDYKPFLKNDFWFRHGRQGMYNVLRTGHYHGFNVLRQTSENLHYQCPAIFPGNFFSESLGFDSVPAITIIQHEAGVPRIDYRPLTAQK